MLQSGASAIFTPIRQVGSCLVSKKVVVPCPSHGLLFGRSVVIA